MQQMHKKAFSIRKDFSNLVTMENNDTIQQTFHSLFKKYLGEDHEYTLINEKYLNLYLLKHNNK